MGSSCVPCTAPFHPSWPPCTAPNAGAKLLAPSDPFLLPCYGFLSPSENKQTCSCPTSNPPCHTCSDFISALSLPHLMGLTYQPHTGTSNFLPQVAWSSVRSLPPPPLHARTSLGCSQSRTHAAGEQLHWAMVQG